MKAPARLAMFPFTFLFVAAVGALGAGCDSQPESHTVLPAKTPPGASVVATAKLAASASPARATPAPNTILMKDNFFEPKDLTAKAGQEVTLTLRNTGLVLHNMHIAPLDGNFDSPLSVLSNPEFVTNGKTATLTWTPPSAGTYRFRCDIHPDLMMGTITVN